jgi:hypothetical protein
LGNRLLRDVLMTCYRNTSYVLEVCLASADRNLDHLDACEAAGNDDGKSSIRESSFADLS